ncbi:MAG: restriction endonuclease subunit S [Bacteroidaceae bacterium]|nr:restriction endonuclease subunit S [Bacteroidaceae bacterium]
MEQWKEYKLKDLVIVITDKTDTSVLDDYNYISTENMLQNKAGVSKSSGIPAGNCIHFKEDDILISNIRPYFKKIWRANKEGGCSADVICYRANNKVDSLFLYYLMSQDSFFEYVMKGSKGTKMPRGDKKQILQWNISLPPFEQQKKIASILKSLDDKIEVNRRINDNLEQQAQALFKSWFVDFEPFKDGEFEESEIGMIPKGWKVGTLFDVASIYDKLRKPLSGKDRENMERIYPYYGATSCMDYVDNFIFDGIYTLIGEDGSVVKEDGLPYMQYVWGKFWVNNHAHILRGKNGFSTEMVHVLLSITNIQHLVTGAVQAKLSQANMQKLVLALPPKNVINEIRPIIGSLYETRRGREEESRRLAQLRDTLLPRLMSGELNPGEIHL